LELLIGQFSSERLTDALPLAPIRTARVNAGKVLSGEIESSQVVDFGFDQPAPGSIVRRF
jgi:hypothetical protein